MALTKHEEEIYKQITAVEPEITDTIQKLSNKAHMPLFGLDFRLKTKASLNEKLHERMQKTSIESTKDIVRYTMLSNEEDYASNVQSMLDYFEKSKRFDLTKVTNYWTKENIPYQGINTQIYDHKTGLAFEIQYHTEESVLKKEITHKLYEAGRVLSNDDPIKEQLDRQQMEINQSIPIPKNAKTIKSFQKTCPLSIPKTTEKSKTNQQIINKVLNLAQVFPEKTDDVNYQLS